MLSKVRQIGKAIHHRYHRRALATRAEVLRRLVDGEVDGAITLLASADQATRRMTLNKSVTGNPNPNWPREARAPTAAQQVDFFVRTRAITPLRPIDDLKFHVALNYQAVEAGDEAVIRQESVYFDEQLPKLKKKRAYLDGFLLSGKRGHHLYYSAALSRLHTTLAMADRIGFQHTSNDADAFFRQVTLSTCDKGFGWALPNALRIAGLAGLYWMLKGDMEQTKSKWALLPEMTRLAVTKQVGSVEYPQVRRAFRYLETTASLQAAPDDEAISRLFKDLVRLRADEAHERLYANFMQMTQ